MRSTARVEDDRDSLRFIVRHTEHGYTIDVVGQDPDTRYVPREQRTLWRRILDRLKLGLQSIRHVGI